MYRFFGIIIVFLLIQNTQGQWYQRLEQSVGFWSNSPEARPEPRTNAAIACDGENFLLFGGKTRSNQENDVWLYEKDTNRFIWLFNGIKNTTTAPMPRSNTVHWFMDGKMWILGGYNTKQGVLGDFWTFDPKIRQWQQQISVYPRYKAMGWVSTLNSIMFLFGGQNEKEEYLADTWMYDTQTWTIVRNSESPEARINAAIASSDELQKIYMFGGKTINDTYLNDLWSFDKVTYVWLKHNSLIEGPAAREEAMMWFTSSVTLLLFGGKTRHIVHQDLWTHNLHDGEDKSWISTSFINTPKQRYGSAVCTIDSTFHTYLFGGETIGSIQYLNDLWIYGTTLSEEVQLLTPNIQEILLIFISTCVAISVLFIIIMVLALICWGICKKRTYTSM